MVSRVGPASDSRLVFREKVLGADQEPGITVADRSYMFWEVEHAYTYKAPAATSLTAAFLDYLRSTQARPVLARGDLVPCSDLPAGFYG